MDATGESEEQITTLDLRSEERERMALSVPAKKERGVLL